MAKVTGVISDKYKFIVLLLPKNASSTLRMELRKEEYQTYELHDNKWNDNHRNDYKIFAFLRNPLDRFFSGYHEVYIRHLGLEAYNKNHNINRERPLEFLNMQDTVETIYEFLQHIKERGFFETHIKRQIDFIKTYPIHAYFTVKNSNTGIQHIRELCGLPLLKELLPMHRRRKRNSRFLYYKEDMPSYIMDLIQEIYQEDILLFEKMIVRPR